MTIFHKSNPNLAKKGRVNFPCSRGSGWFCICFAFSCLINLVKLMKVELWWYQLIWIASPPLLDTQGYLPKSRYMKIRGAQTCVVLPFFSFFFFSFFFYWHQRYGLHLVCQARCIDDLYSTSKYKVGPYSYAKFMINVWHQKQRGCICYKKKNLSS